MPRPRRRRHRRTASAAYSLLSFLSDRIVDLQAVVAYTGLRYALRFNTLYHRIFGNEPLEDRRKVLAELEELKEELETMEGEFDAVTALLRENLIETKRQEVL